MDKKNTLKSKPHEKVVFLGREQDIRKQGTPTVLLLILAITLAIVFWKIAVRDPGAAEKSQQMRAEMLKKDQERIREENKKRQQNK